MNNQITSDKLLSDKLSERWPKDKDGQPEKPVLFCNCRNLDLRDELRINMLEAYGIPCLRIYPGDGSFGKLVLGMSGQGTDIYVPESMLSDATELCQGEADSCIE